MMGRPVMSKETAGNWQPPRELPDLRRVGILALDTETKDDGLAPTGLRLAVSRRIHLRRQRRLSREAATCARSIFRSAIPTAENFDPEQVYHWLRDQIAAGVRFVTQNGLYDWGWLRAEAGITCRRANARRDRRARHHGGREPLSLLPRRVVRLARAARQGRDAAHQGVAALGLITKNARSSCRRTTSGNCRRAMSALTPKPMRSTRCCCWKVSIPILDREGTRAAYRLECDLLPMVLEMRRRGIRIDRCRRRAGARSAAGQARRRTRRAVGQARLPVSMHEIGTQQMAGRDLRSRKASSIRAPRKAIRRSPAANGLDGQASALAAATDRQGQQVQQRGGQLPRRTTSLVTPSTAAFTPKSIRIARRTAARSRCASPIPIRRCNRCRRATRSWRR